MRTDYGREVSGSVGRFCGNEGRNATGHEGKQEGLVRQRRHTTARIPKLEEKRPARAVLDTPCSARDGSGGDRGVRRLVLRRAAHAIGESPMGFMPQRLMVIGTCVALVALPVATVGGAYVYKEM